MPSFTTLRTVALYIPSFSGTLSILGSGSIIYSIYVQRKDKLKDPQHRILLAMSIFDVFYSLCKALTFALYPSGLGIPAFGNSATCTMQGFFTHFSYGAGLYNLLLSIYYFLTIVKGMKRHQFAVKVERYAHALIISMILGFAGTSAGIGLYNPTPAFCFIAPKGPPGCAGKGTCVKFGDSASIFYEMFAQLWIQLAYVGVIVTNVWIWWYVRQQERSMLKYTHPTRAQEQRKQRTKHARKVMVQSLLYVGAFFLTWTWATVFHLATWITGKTVFWPVLLINVFIPLQGFWNAFIYARPRFIRIRQQGEKLTFWRTLQLVFFPESSRKELSASATISASLNASNVKISMNGISSSLKTVSKVSDADVLEDGLPEEENAPDTMSVKDIESDSDHRQQQVALEPVDEEQPATEE